MWREKVSWCEKPTWPHSWTSGVVSSPLPCLDTNQAGECMHARAPRTHLLHTCLCICPFSPHLQQAPYLIEPMYKSVIQKSNHAHHSLVYLLGDTCHYLTSVTPSSYQQYHSFKTQVYIKVHLRENTRHLHLSQACYYTAACPRLCTSLVYACNTVPSKVLHTYFNSCCLTHLALHTHTHTATPHISHLVQHPWGTAGERYQWKLKKGRIGGEGTRRKRRKWAMMEAQVVEFGGRESVRYMCEKWRWTR